MMLVQVKESDKRLGVKKGEVYVAEQYHLDPHEKCTLLRRLPDMHEPMCNQYWHEVEIMGNFSPTSAWMKKIRT